MLKYHRFTIEKYKAVKDSSISVLYEPIPLIGVNESGKSSALEAMARFDFRNDNIADQKGWKFFNRYMPSEKIFSIVAELDVDAPEELANVAASYTEPEQEEIGAAVDSIAEGEAFTIKRVFEKAADGSFSTKYYLGEKTSPVVERFARDVLAQLPRIFYFDNFLEDQFPDKVEFPAEYFTNPAYILDEYQSIVEGMFEAAGVSLKSFLNETDENTKQTQILEVKRVTTQTLMAEWTAMHIGKSELDIGSMTDLQIDLQQDRVNAHAVDINILEKFEDEAKETHTTSMLLSERSLGFRWFFNFSAKKSYGARGEARFIYLFDEPGSYLHNGAQAILLKAMSDLAKAHPVIFSTHSEFLLDPDVININNVRIVEKEDRQIRLVPLAEMKEKRTQGALSTLYNALRMKVPISSTIDQKVIITEGITDFYFWKMVSKDLVILPGFGAGQNEYLISIAIGTAKRYLAWFDGDVAGQQAIEKYTRFFGEKEKGNWKKYTAVTGAEVTLEHLLSAADQKRLSATTGVKDLKKAITSLFFSAQKDTFWSGIDDETKNNIKVNIRTIESILAIKFKGVW